MTYSQRHIVAYYRTSAHQSAKKNATEDKDTLPRQKEACAAWAASVDGAIAAEYYDAAVSGADKVMDRPEFQRMLEEVPAGAVIVVEQASRFARDLMVQLVGHDMLKQRGIELVCADAPTYFTEETDTAIMVRQILGAVSEFQRRDLVGKLYRARVRTGRMGGRQRVSAAHAAEATRLRGKGLSLRAIAKRLEAAGMVGEAGRYGPATVGRMCRAMAVLLALWATPAYAVQAELGVRVNIVQCGSMEDIEQACLDDERCCVFMGAVEPAAGIESEDIGVTRCELWDGPGEATDVGMCYELVE